ncbi:hypothetical protein B9Z55_028835 [Caenorhabditis nigoni]|uniref:Uncharacterized protein n=1 Tax=Caenorhabditis nigoni TaxID=1611254 RepID=A0A2G5SA64_9PELO|nr:hypothetical protein B9Z55_028835 [Caenorhabditis nigoni]
MLESIQFHRVFGGQGFRRHILLAFLAFGGLKHGPIMKMIVQIAVGVGNFDADIYQVLNIAILRFEDCETGKVVLEVAR